MQVCVYCASSDLIAEHYKEVARQLGGELARRGWPVIYGGGSVGLMGAVARAAHAAGGRVVGIIPQALLDREVGYLEADELIVTTTLRERKRLLDEHSDALITLAGGFGTLEELLEMITLRQLGYHAKPIIIINTGGFFDSLLAQFEHIFDQGFARKPYEGMVDSATGAELYHVVDDVVGALAFLEQYEGPGARD